MSGGAETVQKRCSFAALRSSGTKTGPFLVRYRGGGSRFPEDRGGVEATRRVKLNGAENENRYKNGTETFGNVRAGWVSRWGWAAPSAATAALGSAPPCGQSVRVGKIDERSDLISLGWLFALSVFHPFLSLWCRMPLNLSYTSEIVRYESRLQCGDKH